MIPKFRAGDKVVCMRAVPHFDVGATYKVARIIFNNDYKTYYVALEGHPNTYLATCFKSVADCEASDKKRKIKTFLKTHTF